MAGGFNSALPFAASDQCDGAAVPRGHSVAGHIPGISLNIHSQRGSIRCRLQWRRKETGIPALKIEPKQPEIISCPYCHGQLGAGALSCRHCSRDLTPVLPLLSQIAVLESRLLAVEEMLKSTGHEQRLLPAPSFQTPVDYPDPGRRQYWALVAGFLALLSVYTAVVLWLDLPLSVLRLASIAIPLATGFVYFGPRYKLQWPETLVAILFAVSSVFTMSLILAKVDSIPLLPQGAAAWRETMYYVVSITASMMSGMLLRMSIMALGVRGLTSLPRLRQGLLTVNKTIPTETLKSIELAVLLVGSLVSAIAGLFAGIVGLSG